MKIAIHQAQKNFSDRWIAYCESHGINYKIVDCYSTNIMQQLEDCDGLMWHWNQEDYKGILFARQLTLSLEKKGIKVFPNTNTAWHHDDKVGQKYLMEAIGAPLVPSHVFYDKATAIKWLKQTTFPKVFKLRGGAGSVNVKLANNYNEAIKFVNTAFGRGFAQINEWDRLKNRLWAYKRDKNVKALKGVAKGVGRLVIPTELEKFSHDEKGYIYFQDFLPNNTFDSRIVVIGNRCFAVRRYTRTNDFRASGSGVKAYEPELFDPRAIKIAFETTRKIGAQSAAYDFVFDGTEPKIIEVSYCFIIGPFYDDCPGYWDESLNWHNKPVNPQHFMIEDFVNEIDAASNVKRTRFDREQRHAC
jgi:hypothetical protein